MKVSEYIKRFGKIVVKDEDTIFYCDGKDKIGGTFNKKGRML